MSFALQRQLATKLSTINEACFSLNCDTDTPVKHQGAPSNPVPLPVASRIVSACCTVCVALLIGEAPLCRIWPDRRPQFCGIGPRETQTPPLYSEPGLRCSLVRLGYGLA